jgi:hypothetical protein
MTYVKAKTPMFTKTASMVHQACRLNLTLEHQLFTSWVYGWRWEWLNDPWRIFMRHHAPILSPTLAKYWMPREYANLHLVKKFVYTHHRGPKLLYSKEWNSNMWMVVNKGLWFEVHTYMHIEFSVRLWFKAMCLNPKSETKSEDPLLCTIMMTKAIASATVFTNACPNSRKNPTHCSVIEWSSSSPIQT